MFQTIDPFRGFRQNDYGLYVPPASDAQRREELLEADRQAAMAIARSAGAERTRPDVPLAFWHAFEEDEV